MDAHSCYACSAKLGGKGGGWSWLGGERGREAIRQILAESLGDTLHLGGEYVQYDIGWFTEIK